MWWEIPYKRFKIITFQFVQIESLSSISVRFCKPTVQYKSLPYWRRRKDVKDDLVMAHSKSITLKLSNCFHTLYLSHILQIDAFVILKIINATAIILNTFKMYQNIVGIVSHPISSMLLRIRFSWTTGNLNYNV